MSIDNQSALGILRQPRTVLFGPGRRHQLPRLVREIASHLLVTTDERMATTSDLAEIIAGIEAEGVTVSIYSETEPDLPRENVLAVAERFRGRGVDAVLGVGGGSCLDMAKVASLALSHGGDVRDYYGEFQVPGPVLPIITLPTTGGTGAEVTCIAVVFDRDRGMKVGVASPHLEAWLAVVDPELTLSCPPGLTAATGADALSHIVEAFTDRAKNPDVDALGSRLYVGKNLLTDVYARHGLSLLAGSLERVAADPADLDARSDTMLGAFCAGMSINTAGTAAAHAIQSPIGALTHTPHGFGVSALLPYVMRFNLPARVAVFAEMAGILGVADGGEDDLERAHRAIERVEGILTSIGAPTDLKTLGLEQSDFEYVADQALLATRLTANNPRELTRENIVGILEKGYAGDRSWWELT